MKRALTGAAAAALMLLGACSSEMTGTATPANLGSDDGEVSARLADLHAAILDTGTGCDNLQAADSGPALEAGTCERGANDELILQLWRDADDRDDGTSDLITERRNEEDYCFIVGRGNTEDHLWSVDASSTGPSTCRYLGAELQDSELFENMLTPSSPTSSAPPLPPANGVGATVPFSGTIQSAPAAGAVTLNGIRRVAAPEVGYSDSVPTHGSWLVIDVTISSTQGDIPYNALDWSVSTAQGQVEEYAFAVVENQLEYGTVLPGRVVRGELAFDVPEGPVFIDYSLGFDVVTTFEVTG